MEIVFPHFKLMPGYLIKCNVHLITFAFHVHRILKELALREKKLMNIAFGWI